MTASPSSAPVVNRRERNRARRHEAIAAAALELFTEQGYEATTVEDIAQRADVSMRTFFRYFATKDQTVFSDILPTTRGIGQRVSARPSSEHPWTTLSTAYAAIARQHTADDIRRIKARYRLIRSTPALLARHAEHNRREQHEVVRALLDARPDASEGELTLLVSVAYTTIWHAVDRWAADDGSDELAAALDHAFGLLPRALLAATPTPQSNGSTPERPAPRGEPTCSTT